MAAPPASSAPAAVTYPHLGTLLIGVGIGVTSFTAAAGDSVPGMLRGILVGIGSAAGAVGAFLLGRSSI